MLLEVVEDPFDVSDGALVVTPSIGVAAARDPASGDEISAENQGFLTSQGPPGDRVVTQFELAPAKSLAAV